MKNLKHKAGRERKRRMDRARFGRFSFSRRSSFPSFTVEVPPGWGSGLGAGINRYLDTPATRVPRDRGFFLATEILMSFRFAWDGREMAAT